MSLNETDGYCSDNNIFFIKKYSMYGLFPKLNIGLPTAKPTNRHSGVTRYRWIQKHPSIYGKNFA